MTSLRFAPKPMPMRTPRITKQTSLGFKTNSTFYKETHPGVPRVVRSSRDRHPEGGREGFSLRGRKSASVLPPLLIPGSSEETGTRYLEQSTKGG
jgi:hypothetical protein